MAGIGGNEAIQGVPGGESGMRAGPIVLRLTLATGMLLGAAGSAGAAQAVLGYTDLMSYVHGDTIAFYASTDSPTYRIELVRDSRTPQIVATLAGLPGATQPAIGLYGPELWKGLAWSVSHTVTIPPAWPPGYYYARFVTEDGTDWYRPFVLRTSLPGSTSRVVFVANYNTSNAYDNSGGKGLYTPANAPATHVGFRRPWVLNRGLGKHYYAQREMVYQLEGAGFAPEYITEWDIHSIPRLLRAYDVVVLAGHHEYISRPIYDALQEHHDRGGHLAFFSGNDLWWQVRYEEDGDVMVCYKSTAHTDDPMNGVNDALVTTHWHEPPLNRPGEALQGIRFSSGVASYVNTDYLVENASHWVLAGTGLMSGDRFGDLLASSETDELGPASPPVVDVILRGRRPLAVPTQGAPPYVDGLAIYYEDTPAYGWPDGRGGQVFSSGGDGGWVFGLGAGRYGYQDVRRATNNVIQHMLDAPHDCDDNGIEDAADIAACGPGDPACADCNGNGIPDGCDLANCPAGITACEDCNLNGVPDQCDIAAGAPDADGDGRPDTCDPDCNGNQFPDHADLATGASLDCNGNEVPDECDIASAASRDGDGNGTPDECDLEAFRGCATRAKVSVATGCDFADLDSDGDADQTDFGILQHRLSGQP